MQLNLKQVHAWIDSATEWLNSFSILKEVIEFGQSELPEMQGKKELPRQEKIYPKGDLSGRLVELKIQSQLTSER